MSMESQGSPLSLGGLPTHLTNGAEGPSAELKEAVRTAFDQPNETEHVDATNANEGVSDGEIALAVTVNS